MSECKDNIPSKEAVYISAYTIIKKMLSDGVISEKIFSRLNEKIPECQNTVLPFLTDLKNAGIPAFYIIAHFTKIIIRRTILIKT